MNAKGVENILNAIKATTDKSVIARNLIKLRIDVVKDVKGIILFRNCGGIAPVVRLFSKPHEKTLEIALSILGNCCVDDACCKEVFKHNIIPSVISILKSTPNQIIRCRACRLLGNLAKADVDSLVKSTNCMTMVQVLCDIIQHTSDVQTRGMAFRVCRLLLNSENLNYFLQCNILIITINKLTSLMKNTCTAKEKDELLQAVSTKPKVGLKDSQHREKYFEETALNLEGVRSDIFDYELLKNNHQPNNDYIMPTDSNTVNLLNEILKCLMVLSGLHISLPVWRSFHENGCSFAAIVFLVQNPCIKYRSTALKILSNFVKNTGAFDALSSANAVLAACEVLMIADPTKQLNEFETRNSINIISVLSADACNRAKIRRSGALKKLMSIMRECKSHSEKFMILHVFQNFQYDEMSMNLMLREGLFNVLINELRNYTLSDEDYYKMKREEKLSISKKRKLPNTETKSSCKIRKLDKDITYEYDSSVGSATPNSSRSLSPTGPGSYTNGYEHESYSPVCSDEDEDNGNADDNIRDNSLFVSEQACDTLESLIINSFDTCTKADIIEENLLLDKDDVDDDDNTSQDDVPNLKVPQIGNLPNKSIDIIENLLYRITCLVKKISDLGKTETIITLTKALVVFGASMDLSGTLTNILMESQFFVQVIKSGIAHQLYQLTKINDLRKEGFAFLATLTPVGECYYGKEQLAFFLRSDNPILQKRAAITVGYVIKNKSLLHQFLNDCNCLSLLFSSILSDQQDEYTTEAIDSLTHLCRHTLGIQLPYEENCESNADGSSEMYDIFEVQEDTPLYDDCDIYFHLHSPIEENDEVEEEEGKPAATTLIAFNKALLCSSSDVFNVMLNSDFREGIEGEIHLRTYTVAGVRYFLNLIVRQAFNSKMNIPPVDNFTALLEAFEMSRIYNVPQLEEVLQQFLVYRLNESSCVELLEWSLNNCDDHLSKMTLNFYLCSNLTSSRKIALFRNTGYSHYSSQWLQMLFEVVFSYCTTTS